MYDSLIYSVTLAILLLLNAREQGFEP
jgi:hypothetical protein